MTRPARWLVLASCVPPEGGLGGIVRYTTEMLAALGRRDDVEVSAVARAEAAETVAVLVGDRGRVGTVPDRLPSSLAAAVEPRHGWARRGGFDVVLATKHLLPPRSDAFRALTVHDMVLLDRPADYPSLKRRMLPGPYLRSVRSADLVLCISEATRARTLAHAPEVRARTRVVPLATAGSLRTAAPAAPPALAGRRFVLVVGDGSPRKNVGAVLAAWPAVARAHPDALLAMVGPRDWSGSAENPERTALLEAGGALSLSRLSDGALRWCYQNAAAVACPSFSEGYGLPVAEALDLGAPVVVSTDAAMVEVAAGRAHAVVAPTDVAGWSAAIDSLLTGDHGSAPITSTRSWDDVADETVRAVRDAQGSQTGSGAPGGRP